MFRFGMIVAGLAGLAGCVGEEAALVATAADPAPVVIEPAVAAPVAHGSRSKTKVAGAPLPPQRPFIAAPVAAARVRTETGIVAETAPEPAAVAVAAAPEAYAASTGSVETPFSGLFTPATFTPAPATAGVGPRDNNGAWPPGLRDDDELEIEAPANTNGARPTKRSTAPGQRYYAAYNNTVVSCFPQALREALNTIAEHYGKDVEVTSGFRSNGRRGSYHRKCMAADIRVEGVRPSDLSTFVRGIDGVNGVGTYRHTSVTHIDVRDYQMSWRY